MRKIIFSVCLGLILILAACSNDEETNDNTEAAPTPVEVAKVKTGDFIIEKTLYGETSPEKQMPVMLEQPSEIKTVHVKNGDKVKKDDKLITIKTPAGDQSVNASTDGVVGQLTAKAGSFQSNEDPILVIADLDTLTIHYMVTANARDLFKVDDKLDVEINNDTYEAKVTSIDTLPNETGQYAVEFELENKDNDVLPGEPAKVLVAEEKVKKTKIIPTEAVLTEGDEQFIFIVRDDQVERVLVEVQETQSDKSAVKADIKKDDQVVVNGHFTLTDQAEVDVQKEDK